MSRALWSLIVAIVLTAAGGAQTQPRSQAVEVFKSPTCGCCSKWVEHMKKAGYTVRVTDIDATELQKLKAKYGVPQSAASCHTARVGGYTLEGHIPASQINRLLGEKRKVAGLAVPGMPVGSPGMEVPGVKGQPYDVLSFDRSGRTAVFSTVKPD